MRTTLTIDDDVLMATREIAQQEGVSISKVVSRLIREALTHQVDRETRNGVPIFPRQPKGQVVTLQLVNALRDELAE